MWLKIRKDTLRAKVTIMYLCRFKVMVYSKMTHKAYWDVLSYELGEFWDGIIFERVFELSYFWVVWYWQGSILFDGVGFWRRNISDRVMTTKKQVRFTTDVTHGTSENSNNNNNNYNKNNHNNHINGGKCNGRSNSYCNGDGGDTIRLVRRRRTSSDEETNYLKKKLSGGRGTILCEKQCTSSESSNGNYLLVALRPKVWWSWCLFYFTVLISMYWGCDFVFLSVKTCPWFSEVVVDLLTFVGFFCWLLDFPRVLPRLAKNAMGENWSKFLLFF